ncbi:hypothetical protein Tco_0473315, partial [Tanacetum coccineum]
MVAEEAVDEDDSEHVVFAGDVILEELYVVIIAQEGVFPADDGDVIPNELYAEMVAQEGVGPVDDRGVIPDEVVAEER